MYTTILHIYVQLEGFTKVNPFIQLINRFFFIIIIQPEDFSKVISCSAYGNTPIALFGFEHSMCQQPIHHLRVYMCVHVSMWYSLGYDHLKSKTEKYPEKSLMLRQWLAVSWISYIWLAVVTFYIWEISCKQKKYSWHITYPSLK